LTPRSLLPGLLACCALAACASRPPDRYNELPITAQLQPTNSDTMPFAYGEPARWRDYSAIIIDPIAIYSGADHQFGDLSDSQRRELASTMDRAFRQALRSRFMLSDSDSVRPGTLRLRLTLTGAKGNTAVVSTVTRFDLVGLPYNTVQALRGKEGIFMGSVSYSVEVSDAMSNHLLKAYQARQYPNAMNVSATFGSLGAARTGLEKGAQELLAELQ